MNSRRSSLIQLTIVTLLAIPLIAPLMQWSAVPCTHDGHLHVHRVAALRYAWENGAYFSRWVPDLAFGYGYPFFVYREPVPLYAILFPHLLGLPLPAASNLFYALTILASGWFMFLWVRDIAGSRAAFVSAVAYMAAPYVLIDALVRGNAPESMALPLFPFLLWMGRRWIIDGTAVPFLLATIGLVLLSLSHNISILIFTPALLVYLLAVGLLHELSWTSLIGRLLLLFVLGLGAAFFYTGGALLEMDQVTLSQSVVTRNNDFHFNFASLGEILAPVRAANPDLVNPPLLIRLGWIPFILALLGAATPFWNHWISKEQRWHIILMAAAALIFLFMALPISLPLWEGLPLIDFVQFPWRFVGRAALPVAFLAGMPFMKTPGEDSDLRRHRAFTVATIVAVALLILEAIPALYPRTCEEDAFPTILDVHNYESATGLVGIDPEGSYFPRTVKRRPDGSPLEVDYQEGRTPQRFDLSRLPAAAVANAEYDRLAAEITVDTPEAFTARYLTFAFPGWEVIIDGQPALVSPSDPEGLITFPVPAGEHRIEVSWQSTPLRTSLALVSVLSLFGILIVVFYLDAQNLAEDVDPSWQQPDFQLWFGLAVLALGLLLFKNVLVDANKTPLRQSAGPDVGVPAELQAEQLQFAGHTLRSDEVAAGETFEIDLAWRTTAPTSTPYQSNIWLAGADGLIWSEKETQRPRLFEDGPAAWERGVGQWSLDSREVQVLPGTPPGTYDVIMTLFDRDTLQPVTLISESGEIVGPTAVIDQIEVTMPGRPAQFRPQYPLELPMDGAGLTLLGYNQDRTSAAPGEAVLLTLFWERTAGPLPSTTTVQLLDGRGQLIHSWEVPLIADGFDDNAWSTGQRLRAQHLLRLPSDLEGGAYQFSIEDGYTLGDLFVTAPSRLFAQPAFDVNLSIPFADEVLLTGYTTARENENLTVDLVWQAAHEMSTAYRVFVHLVDEQGAILAQSDGEPDDWSRPTTGWAEGEYVVDRHTLTLPPGSELEQLSLRIGLYDPADGRRVLTGSGDAAELPAAVTR
jgi:hypothetical protein